MHDCCAEQEKSPIAANLGNYQFIADFLLPHKVKKSEENPSKVPRGELSWK